MERLLREMQERFNLSESSDSERDDELQRETREEDPEGFQRFPQPSHSGRAVEREDSEEMEEILEEASSRKSSHAVADTSFKDGPPGTI